MNTADFMKFNVIDFNQHRLTNPMHRLWTSCGLYYYNELCIVNKLEFYKNYNNHVYIFTFFEKSFSVFWFTKLLYISEQECVKFNFPPNDKFRNLLPYDPELIFLGGGGGQSSIHAQMAPTFFLIT